MSLRHIALSCALAAAGIGASAAGSGQSTKNVETVQPVGDTEASSAVPSRVIAPIDETRRVRLTGNTHFQARPEFDKGLVDPQLSLERMVLVLKRSPAQEAALEKFMAEQWDPHSPNFHRWLEPEEFGRLYGPSDPDITAVTSWIENHGFRIDRVSKGRVTLEFSGTAEQVQETFHTEIHRFEVSGERHIANVRDPEIPEALAPVITGIASLHDFFPRHQSHFGKYVKRNKKTGAITPVDPEPESAFPQLTYTDAKDKVHEDVSPGDFVTIYNVMPLWNAGIDGAGVKIAISAISDILQNDVDAFRSSFGLPQNTVNQIHNGTDPGVVAGGGQGENTLDAEWAGVAAKNATIDLVVTASQGTTFGGQLSDSYIVDNKTAPVMSASYGNCEGGLGAAGNAAYNGIYQQGSAEGISMFSSAGDQGSAGCDETGGAADTPAKHGLQVNGLASSPYVTAVGGTDFNFYQNNVSTYWNASNASSGDSAKGYVPEVPWDSTCTSQWLLLGSPSFNTSEDICAYASYTVGLFGIFRVAGGSGGVSACTSITGGDLTTCSGGYAKPAWQAGTGVPADGKRDVPDVSLFASDGFPDGIVGNAYLFCLTSNSPEGSCAEDYNNASDTVYQEVGGTSVASPAMAGIMALVVQKQGGKWQGLANPVFYKLAAKENISNCNSSTVKNGNSCVFYDITSGTNAQPCVYASLDCNTPVGYAVGIGTGYNAGTGYDLATGLGSVNATNLVNGWSSATAAGASLSVSKLTFASTKVGSSSAPQTVTLTNSGVATLDIASGGISVSGTDPKSFPFTTNCGATLGGNKNCTITVTFKPAATGAQSATLQIADNAAGSPQKVMLTGTGAAAGSVVLSATALAFPNTAVGAESEAQTVTVTNQTATAITLKSIAIGGTNPQSFVEVTNCTASLAAGKNCAVFVAFDPKKASAASASLTVSDSASGSPQSVTLKGMGTAAAQVKLSKPSLTFGSAAKGTTTDAQSVTLTNGGSTAVEITSIAVTGADASSFIELNTCPATLAPSANCAIYVAFEPAGTGALSAKVIITDSGSGSPQGITLSGTGTP